MFMRIDHIGIACHDLEEKIELFSRTFDLTVVAREVNEEQGVKEAMLHISDGEGGGSYIQLLEPLSEESPVGKFLARRGEGVHHVAFGVPDVADAMHTRCPAGSRAR
jgi:methylmalonyl-CoA/ethylmalonyl-CoA epimerase